MPFGDQNFQILRLYPVHFSTFILLSVAVVDLCSCISSQELSQISSGRDFGFSIHRPTLLCLLTFCKNSRSNQFRTHAFLSFTISKNHKITEFSADLRILLDGLFHPTTRMSRKENLLNRSFTSVSFRA